MAGDGQVDEALKGIAAGTIGFRPPEDLEGFVSVKEFAALSLSNRPVERLEESLRGFRRAAHSMDFGTSWI